jgi:alkylation response protein AidB-like acyl-CoA dehydrogenase
MRFELSPEQAFFRETTDRFLTEHVPVGEIRRLREDPEGFSEGYWRQGAELGWTSLLVSETPSKIETIIIMPCRDIKVL